MNLRPGTEIDEHQEMAGIDPRTMDRTALEALGHAQMPVLSVIRAKCLDCCSQQIAEVRRCTSVACALWPYRMGSNPLKNPREISDEQRAAMSERLKASREKRANG